MYEWNYTNPDPPNTYLVSGYWFAQNSTMLVNLPSVNSGIITILMKQLPVPKLNMLGFYNLSKFITPPHNDT